MTQPPQRQLIPTIFECTNGSSQMSEQLSHRSGTLRNSLAQLRRNTTESDNPHQRTESSLVYTISNHKASHYDPIEFSEPSSKPMKELQTRINQCTINDYQNDKGSNRFVYPTFNPSYSSLNLGHRNSNVLGQENLDIINRVNQYKKQTFDDNSKYTKRSSVRPNNTSFIDQDRSQILADITYDQESSRLENSVLMVNRRRPKSLYRRTCGNSVEYQPQSDFYENVAAILGVDGEDEIYGKLKQLNKQNHRYEKFLGSIQDMIMKLTPPEQYGDCPPDLKQSWRWIKGILQDYMQLKKGPTAISKKKQDILSFLMLKLGVEREEEIPRQVDEMIEAIIEQKNYYNTQDPRRFFLRCCISSRIIQKSRYAQMFSPHESCCQRVFSMIPI